MDTSQIFFTQIAVNTFVYALAALWYLVPRLSSAPLAVALAPLLFLNTIRTVGLVFLVPGVVGSRLPDALAVPAAYGDSVAAILALLALLALRARWRLALACVWLFNLEGAVDLLYAFGQVARVNLAANYALGSAWFIPTFLAPAMLLSHILIFWLLLRPRPAAQATAPTQSEMRATV